MFVRSRNGKRIVEARDFEVKDTRLYINGSVFEEYESEAAALDALVSIGRELADLETFVDLSGEIESDDFDDDLFMDFDDEYDDDDYDDDDDDDLPFGPGKDDPDTIRDFFRRKK